MDFRLGETSILWCGSFFFHRKFLSVKENAPQDSITVEGKDIAGYGSTGGGFVKSERSIRKIRGNPDTGMENCFSLSGKAGIKIWIWLYYLF